MPTPPISLETALQAVTAVNAKLRAGHPAPGTAGNAKVHGAIRAAADELGISRETFHSRLSSAKRVHGLEPDWAGKGTAKPKIRLRPSVATENPGVVAEIDGVQPKPPPGLERRLRDRVAGLEKQLKDALRENNAQDDLREAVFSLSGLDFSAPQWSLDTEVHSGAPGIPMLFFSDAQWGETIRADDVGGFNQYDHRIAAARYERLISKTIDLCFNHTVNPEYPGIVYMRGGDMVSGEIHEELARTNSLLSVEAVADLVRNEIAGITALAEKFGRVWVISVPGNHGRTTHKPHSKRYSATNYDTLSAWMLEQHFKDRDSRITFWTPVDGDALFNVCGWNFLLTHGDRVGSRGGHGYVGPAATITRGMKKLVDYYSTLGRRVDYCLLAHFHTPMELEYGFSNGSLPGYSEYARDGRFRPSPPAQWLFMVHPHWGVANRWKVFLERHPMLTGDTSTISVG